MRTPERLTAAGAAQQHEAEYKRERVIGAGGQEPGGLWCGPPLRLRGDLRRQLDGVYRVEGDHVAAFPRVIQELAERRVDAVLSRDSDHGGPGTDVTLRLRLAVRFRRGGDLGIDLLDPLEHRGAPGRADSLEQVGLQDGQDPVLADLVKPASAAAIAACAPTTPSGNCYEPGEFCSAADHGMTGVDGSGDAIRCEDNNGWRWEPGPAASSA